MWQESSGKPSRVINLHQLDREPPLLLACGLFAVLKALAFRVQPYVNYDEALMFTESPWTYSLVEIFNHERGDGEICQNGSLMARIFDAANNAETKTENGFFRAIENTMLAIRSGRQNKRMTYDVRNVLSYAEYCLINITENIEEEGAYVRRIFLAVLENARVSL